jgi:hypothetical protein
MKKMGILAGISLKNDDFQMKESLRREQAFFFY